MRVFPVKITYLDHDEFRPLSRDSRVVPVDIDGSHIRMTFVDHMLRHGRYNYAPLLAGGKLISWIDI